MARARKDFDYFQYFCDCAGAACEAANYLYASLCSYERDGFCEKVSAMHQIENRADSAKHEMTQCLAHEFITPIEREDIIALAQELDNVVDAIDDTMRRIYMFNLDHIHPGVLDFAKLIIDCCAELSAAVAEFKNFKSSKIIREKIVAVNTLEYEGDQLHAQCFRELFSGNADTRALLIWTTVFEDLETCLDNCEDAVDIIESVIMKNS